MSGGRASDPAELLRRLRARGGGRAGTAEPFIQRTSGLRRRARRQQPRRARRERTPPGAAAGPHTDSRAAAPLRTAEDAAAALASPDPDLPRERAEIAAGLRAEASDPTRAGMVEVLLERHALALLPRMRSAGLLGLRRGADRGRDGTWYCFEHKERADDHAK